MLLTTEVEVKPSGKMIQYYKDKGYDAKYHTPLIVKVDDLPFKSHALVNVKCSDCESIQSVRYGSYNRTVDEIGKYVCPSCAKKYSIKKQKERNISKYGVTTYSQTKEFKEQYRKSCLNK